MKFRLLVAAIVAGSLMPSAQIAQAQEASPQPVIIGQTYTIDSDVMGTERRVTVRLPPGYVEQPQMRFPVMYVLDGGPQQDFPHIAGIAQRREARRSFVNFWPAM